MGRDVYEYILGQIGPAGAIYQVTLIHHQKVKKGHFGVNSVAKLQ
jgi:hypothetical protein